ncbi:MAG: alpha/beta hydrolase [Muribaculaceae bacterium]|nr:alpha/beta hydrolase [Muribaculaceae bacterium]MDE6633279.1 alpha/beta hydrolase [Muribaculaceae bacterium]
MDKTIDIDGVKLHYRDSGEENLRPVILMHGWGCNVDTVASIENIFKGKMRVINVDLPGHGKSTEPPSVWGVEDFTAMMEKFITMLGLEKPSLIGHSFGGRISILLSSRGDVDKVLLVDSAGIKPKRSLSYYWKVYSFKAMKNTVMLLCGKKKGAEIVDRLRGKKGSADYRNSSPKMRAIMSKCVNEDLKYAMPSIKAPVLLVWGEDDTATPLSDAQTMKKLIPDAGLVSFPGCGHYSFLDNPFGFKAVVSSFFNI